MTAGTWFYRHGPAMKIKKGDVMMTDVGRCDSPNPFCLLVRLSMCYLPRHILNALYAA